MPVLTQGLSVATLSSTRALAGSERTETSVAFWKRRRPLTTRPTVKFGTKKPSCAHHCVEHPGRKKRYQGVERRLDSSRSTLVDPAAPSPDKPSFRSGAPVYLAKSGSTGSVVVDHTGEHQDVDGQQCAGSGDCVELIIIDRSTGEPADSTIHVPYCAIEVVSDLDRPKRCDLSTESVDLADLNRELRWFTTQMQYGNPAPGDFVRRLELQNDLERRDLPQQIL